MAQRVPKKAQATAAPKGAAAVTAQRDLETIQPDREVAVAGETLMVREYRYFEGLQLQARHKAFFDDLYALFGRGEAPPSVDDIGEVLGRHEAATVEMVALSIGKSADWLRSLGAGDGDAVVLTWWMVNGGFFTRRVMRRAMQERLTARSATPGSTTSSSPQDTSGPPTNSPG